MRDRARARRDGLDASVREAASATILTAVLRLLPKLPGVVDALGRLYRGVGLYHSLGSEVGTHALLAALSRRCIPVALPRVQRENDLMTLHFARVDARTALSRSSWGVMEPTADPAGREGCLARLQVLLVPCLAFDADGYRLGYGRGLYDRALARFSGHIIGLAFAAQQVPAIPHEPHDIALHGVLTESGLIVPPHSPLAVTQLARC